jgi:hypothetical protein
VLSPSADDLGRCSIKGKIETPASIVKGMANRSCWWWMFVHGGQR